MSAIDDLASAQRSDADPATAKERLEAMWCLASADVGIEGARITGHGRDASCEVRLTNGEAMVFERWGDIATGAALVAELASCAGVVAKLTQLQKVHSIVLLRTLAERQAAETADSIARDWGIEFLATAQQVEVNMDDQAERWGCFQRLRATDPWSLSREQGCAVARLMLVPVDRAGVRYVRVGWFQMFVRQFDGTVSTPQVVARMLRVGWLRRGTEGRIGARRPGMPGQANVKFLLVPPTWDELADHVVTADTRPAHEPPSGPRAREVSTTSGYQHRDDSGPT